MELFESKKISLKEQKVNKKQMFEENEMVLLSIMVYILSFLQNSLAAWKNKSAKNIEEFFNDFENKTLLSRNILAKMGKYYKMVFNNCPVREYEKAEETYLFTIWSFFKKIMFFSELFHHEHQKIFQIKIEKFPDEKHENIIDDSSCAIKIGCTNDRVAALKILQQKAKCIISCQNIGCPYGYWKYSYSNAVKIPQRNEESVLRKKLYDRILGVHISKTHSN